MTAASHDQSRYRHRLERLGKVGWKPFASAGATLAMASAAVALLPFSRALRFGSVPLGTAHVGTIDDVVWAVQAWSRRLPLRVMCIEQGLAVQRLLRRSGIDARLHYGARHAGVMDCELKAHVWVTVDRVPVIGGDEAQDFTEIASFPK